MAHINSIGAGIESSFAYSPNTTSLTATAIATARGLDDGKGTVAGYLALATSFTDVPNVAEIPAIGTPANIVSVPQYGQSQASQISAQAEPPTLEFTLNYNPMVHNALAQLAGDGIVRAFRLRLANAELPDTIDASSVHSDFYWVGSIAAFSITPALAGANQSTFTVTVTGDFSDALTTVA